MTLNRTKRQHVILQMQVTAVETIKKKKGNLKNMDMGTCQP